MAEREQIAREWLAEAWEHYGCPMSANAVRKGANSTPVQVALRAITKALSQPSFADGVEAAARVAEEGAAEATTKRDQHPARSAEWLAWESHRVAGVQLATAIRSLAPGEGWQDIATAPKDGTNLLLCEDGAVVIGAWLSSFDHEGWSIGDDDNSPETCYHVWAQPTHWRPLPAPPANAPTHKERG